MLKPYQLTDQELAGIGRLIRAFAEIENIIDLYLFELVQIGQGPGWLMLGKMPIRGKLNLLRNLTRTRGDYHIGRFALAFDNAAFKHLLRFRNVFAHGVLLGQTEDGSIAFQTSNIEDVDEAEVSFTAQGVKRSDFITLAENAETIIPALEAALGVQALREKRRSQPLGPSKKAQPARPPSTKHPRQRKPK